MEKKKPYIVVMGSDEDLLEQSVEESMLLDYVLFGNLVITEQGFYQAMILKTAAR